MTLGLGLGGLFVIVLLVELLLLVELCLLSFEELHHRIILALVD